MPFSLGQHRLVNVLKEKMNRALFEITQKGLQKLLAKFFIFWDNSEKREPANLLERI